MIYNEFCGKSLSALGFGAMRLPTLESGEIDEIQLEEMVRLAMQAGVNYYDTAYPYHGGKSEISLGKILAKYPRDSFYLATKYPGHQIVEKYDPKDVFEKQLKKCGVDYFDFYLLHNVYENSVPVYLDKNLGIIDYFLEQKEKGKIKHLGFSCHSGNDTLEMFLDKAGKHMEFCQIQLNWLDWTLQDAKGKVEILNKRNIPIWVMEPVRGGRLCKLSEKDENTLKALRPNESIAAWGFRFLQGIKGVAVTLSGMSNTSQMVDNLATYKEKLPLSQKELDTLFSIADGIKNSVPCTACKYCTDHCPMGLDIPLMIETYNNICVAPTTNAAMRVEFLSENKQPTACVSCGKCAKTCPQSIDIPSVLKDLAKRLRTIPKWRDICVQREKEAKMLDEK